MSGKLQAKGLYKGFQLGRDFLPVVEDFDLSVADGEFIALVGPSGCGKSTLLDILAGFEQPDRGKVMVDGKPIAGPSRKRILMPQSSSVFPWLSAWRNVMFVQNGAPPEENERSTLHYLDLVGLGDFKLAFPHELSGGMVKRLELARALSVKPDILLMDEAFGALDALTRLKLRNELLRVLSVERHTVLLVTHDVEEAVQLADRVVILTPRPARIQRIIEVPFKHPREIASVGLMRLKKEILSDLGVQID